MSDISISPNLMPLKTDKQEVESQKKRKSAQDLESVFLSQILKTLEKTISLDPDKSESSMAKMMFSTVMGQHIAENGGIGLSDFIYDYFGQVSGEELEALEEKVPSDVLYQVKQVQMDKE